ncbi:MAG: Holliday junction resolvase RuvX [Bacilli bacterium]|nr:Holliday junction resolvase RuvX [Bacilli bacterium]
MRYMGLDLGNRTVGVAFSDPLGIVATGYETYRFNEKDLQKVLEYVKMLVVERKVDKIVLGLPKNMDGTLGFQSEYVMSFKKMLEDELSIEVILVDERLTTTQVTRVMIDADLSRKKRKAQVDKLAAVVILQSYLDSKK